MLMCKQTEQPEDVKLFVKLNKAARNTFSLLPAVNEADSTVTVSTCTGDASRAGRLYEAACGL